MKNKVTPDWVDVSHGLGIPFGGIGTGYSVFGKFGFVKMNFNSIPDPETMAYNGKGPKEAYNYLDEPENKAPYALLVRTKDKTIALQETPVAWQLETKPVEKITCYACLPKGRFEFETGDESIDVSMMAFSPMKPYDLENSTIPVQVYALTVKNRSDLQQNIELCLSHRDQLTICKDMAVWQEKDGEVAFAFENGLADERGAKVTLTLDSGEEKSVRLFIAWCYPLFKTPSPRATETYRRYYTKRFSNATEIINLAKRSAEGWSAAIDQWHESIEVPAYFKRFWFSSLCSVMTSTMLSDDPYFFEIETPHRWVDTMDVNVYSSWLYMINWPEIERMEMNQYLKVIPTAGENKGFVWHSLWDDACDYAEEPTFLTRVWRNYLWWNDCDWLKKAYPYAALAAEYVYEKGHFQELINSPGGNQSYDVWKMPGVSAYVNSAWIYGLHALTAMAEILKVPNPSFVGQPLRLFAEKAAKTFDQLLWNDRQKYWNCFFRTPDAQEYSTPEAAFTDQLFGKWAVIIDATANVVLPKEKILQTLQSLYRHNEINDSAKMFRGWVNGLRPGRQRELPLPEGSPVANYHSYSFWICAQLDLGSLLGVMNDEAASLDVFQSVEKSLHNNHLAVGEYNQSVDDDLKTRTLPEEAPKDTPRFPPYPRYKCSWEYLIRILGLTMDSENLYLSPFRTIDFNLKNIILAGMNMTVRVEAGWSKVYVNGQKMDGKICLKRSESSAMIEFKV